MNPAKALEMQGLLKDRLTLPLYQAAAEGFLTSVQENSWGPIFVDGAGRPDGRGFCQRETQRLAMAEAYFVKKEMMPLVSWAAAGLDVVDRFEHDLWPTDYGFLYFEDGWVGVEIWGRRTVTNAISWGRTVDDSGHPGTLLVMYTDINDERDLLNQELSGDALERTRRTGPLVLQHIAFLADGQRVGPPTIDIAEAMADRKQTAEDIWHSDGEQLQLTGEVPSMTRFFLSLLMMLNQTVTHVAKQDVDRASARRFRRMGLPKQVTVVQLRRHKNIDRLEGETLVEWAHRWIVRGHWRNQPYKAEDGTIAYRRIWIAPYVKGPEDKPLKQSDKVYALVR